MLGPFDNVAEHFANKLNENVFKEMSEGHFEIEGNADARFDYIDIFALVKHTSESDWVLTRFCTELVYSGLTNHMTFGDVRERFGLLHEDLKQLNNTPAHGNNEFLHLKSGPLLHLHTASFRKNHALLALSASSPAKASAIATRVRALPKTV